MEQFPTIKISRETKEKLDLLKIHPRQSYEEVILNLINKTGRRAVSPQPSQKPHGD